VALATGATAQTGNEALELLASMQNNEARMGDRNDARLAPDAESPERLAALAASGDYRIDALVSGYKWNLATVSYSFYEDSVFGGVYYGSETGVREVSEGVKANARKIMAWYGTLLNVNFVEVTETSSNIGLIRFMLSNGPGYAWAYYPSSSTMFHVAGDIHLNPAYDNTASTNGFQMPPGKHGYVSIIHEVGHALGLKHPFDGSPNLPASEDNDSFTVMTYTWPYSTEPGTPMMYDLMALQYLYGGRANRTGNDTYAFTSRGLDQYNLGSALHLDTPYSTRQTIWDTAGANTLDLTSLPASTGYRVDMRELGWMSRLADYNAAGVHFGKGSAIASGVAFRDIVNSGSSDDIYANSQANVFKGYNRSRVTGNDRIFEAGPADTLDLSGYTPSEVTDTQSGNDRVLGLGANGSITIKDYYVGKAPAISYSGVVPSFSINDLSVTETDAGTVTAAFTVTLSSAFADTVTVDFTTSDGTATTAGGDYVGTSGTLTFDPNVTSQPVSVTVYGDNTIEPDEIFYVNLLNPANLTNPGNPPGIGDGQGVGTILTDDVNQPPAANASATPTNGQAPLAVAFSSAGSSDPDGTIASYSWNFGDGGTSTLANPSHTYNSAGTYTATLTVADNLGATGTDTVVITVTAAPLAVGVMSPQGGNYQRNTTVSITAPVTSGGQPVAGATVVFRMTKPGSSKVTKKNATTNSSGVATWNYSVARRDPLGIYTVTATATYGSQSASSQPPHAYFSVVQ
jgi:serralysin